MVQDRHVVTQCMRCHSCLWRTYCDLQKSLQFWYLI